MEGDQKVKNKDITDDDVKKMLDNWDKVRCHRCGKEISMLKAKTVNGGMYFVCSDGCEKKAKWYEDYYSEY
jgi:alpha-D-ribose 1-methylphosphonate 5-phosphate C-P lyase